MFNAYSMMQDLRGMVAEGTAKHWNDVDIVAALNKSLTNVYRKIALTAGDWFVKQSDAITPVAGVITLPTDCSKPIYVEEVSSGSEIPLGIMTIRERATNMRYSDRLSYNGLLAWVEEGTLRVNDDSYVTPVYVWYERRIPLMLAGTASGGSAGGSGSYINFTYDRSVSLVDDYYNGVYIELVSGTGSVNQYLVTDYSASSCKATMNGGYADDTTVFGLVPIIPIEALDYLIHKALLYMILKPGSSVQKEQVYFVRDEVQEAQKDFEAWASSRIKTNSKVRYTGAYSNG